MLDEYTSFWIKPCIINKRYKINQIFVRFAFSHNLLPTQ